MTSVIGPKCGQGLGVNGEPPSPGSAFHPTPAPSARGKG